MALALPDLLRDIVQARLRDFGTRAKAGLAKVILALVAAGLVLSAGLAALADAVGYPVAALVIGGLVALLALAVHLIDRVVADRQAQRIARATAHARADMVVATSVVRSALPLLPFVAFVAAFVLGRRR